MNTKTLGQVCYEAFFKNPPECPETWKKSHRRTAELWEAAAQAVVDVHFKEWHAQRDPAPTQAAKPCDLPEVRK
jgi:hypothetical protein